jgi:hypothetical protein
MTLSIHPRRDLRVALVVAAVAATGCQEDPSYVQSPSLESSGDEMVGMEAAMSVTLPIAPERRTDAEAREALARTLMMPADQVPYVRVDDLDVEIEYTVTNLTDAPGTAFVKINGGNDRFFYVPADFIIDPEEDPEPPSLMGGFPIDVPAKGRVTDTLREDEVREASIALELITRGGIRPEAAILVNHEDIDEWQPVMQVDPEDPSAGTVPVGMPISIRAFAQMVRFDFTFRPDRLMRLDVNLRIRPHRDILPDKLADAPAVERVEFMPVVFLPAGMTAP